MIRQSLSADSAYADVALHGDGLASLQEGKLRYVKTVRMEFTPGLQKGHVEFFNGAIRTAKRWTKSSRNSPSE